MNRELSGIFIRIYEKGKWQSKDITDCQRKTISEFLSQKSAVWIIELVLKLCKTIQELGETFDIQKEER